jgi:hypothetical protein
MFHDPIIINVPVDVLVLINIAFAVGIIWSSLDYYFRSKEHWRWIKMTYALVGLMWVIIYTMVLLDIPYTNTFEFGPDVIRPAITLTLAIMLAGSLTSWYRVTGSKFSDKNPTKPWNKHIRKD